MAFTTVSVTAVCLHSPKQRPKRAAVLSPYLPVFQPGCSLGPACAASSLAFEALCCCAGQWGAPDCQPGRLHLLRLASTAPPGLCHSLPCLCSHWMPCSPSDSVSLASSLIITKLHSRDHVQPLSHQVTSFPGLCLLFPQLPLPQMHGLSCHFQSAESGKLVMLFKQSATGYHSGRWPCHLSPPGDALKENTISHLCVIGDRPF